MDCWDSIPVETEAGWECLSWRWRRAGTLVLVQETLDIVAKAPERVLGNEGFDLRLAQRFMVSLLDVRHQ